MALGPLPYMIVSTSCLASMRQGCRERYGISVRVLATDYDARKKLNRPNRFAWDVPAMYPGRGE
jgi:hypothetical protein